MEENLRIETEEGKYIFVEEPNGKLLRCITKDININKTIKIKIENLFKEKSHVDLDDICLCLLDIIKENLPKFIGFDYEYDDALPTDLDLDKVYRIHTIVDAIIFVKEHLYQFFSYNFYVKKGFCLEDYLPSCAKRIDRYIYNVYKKRLIATIKQIKQEKLSVDKAIGLSHLDSFWSLEEAENYKKEREKDKQNYGLLLSNREKTLSKEIRDELYKLVIKKELFAKDILSCEVCEKIK